MQQIHQSDKFDPELFKARIEPIPKDIMEAMVAKGKVVYDMPPDELQFVTSKVRKFSVCRACSATKSTLPDRKMELEQNPFVSAI